MRLALLGLASACAAASPRIVDRVALSPECPVTPKATVAVTLPDPPSACWRNGRPAAPHARREGDFTYCAPLDMVEVARTEARLRKEFTGIQPPSRLVVDFECDSAGDPIGQAVLEDGSGHGGTLRLAQFERTPTDVRIRSIESSHYFNKALVVRTGAMPLADFDAMMAHARVALVARPHEVKLFDPKATSLSLSGIGTSSNDFYIRLRLVGSSEHPTERAFAGYGSDESREQTLPLQLATEALTKALATLSLSIEPAFTAEDKAFFSERFLATMSEAPRSYWWWVEERYVALAVQLGTFDVVPILAKVAAWPHTPSHDRIRPVALEAIATITGWDPRKDEHGKPVDEDEAARVAMKECDVARR